MVCWAVTMIDFHGNLMGVRMEDTLRLFNMPHLGHSIAYYGLSFFCLSCAGCVVVRYTAYSGVAEPCLVLPPFLRKSINSWQSRISL